jgi:RNA 3'-terminal phosphate cyclase
VLVDLLGQDDVLSYLATAGPVCPRLADRLVLLLALAGQSTFRTTKPAQHTANLD